MNLTRALEVALPDIPARKLAEGYPRLDPGTSFKEHIEDGRPMVRVYVPACSGMYSLTPEQWRIAQLFDGVRSYEQIAEIYSQENNVEYDAASVREFSDMLEANDFWYKTPQEKNILLLKLSVEERKKRLQGRSRWADLSDVVLREDQVYLHRLVYGFEPYWYRNRRGHQRNSLERDLAGHAGFLHFRQQDMGGCLRAVHLGNVRRCGA
jgi:hypothetical protein